MYAVITPSGVQMGWPTFCLWSDEITPFYAVTPPVIPYSKVRDMKHPLAIEESKWLESDEGQRAANPVTLGTTEDKRVYLENRLKNAFRAGVLAVEKLAERKDSTHAS